MRGGSLSRPRGVTEDLPQPWADHACQVGLGLTGSPARGHAGNHRLHDRRVRFIERRKKPVIANVVVARELAGWCWLLAVMDE